MKTFEELLGVPQGSPSTVMNTSKSVTFSFLFFSDVRKDVSDARKYEFMKDVTVFADREGFEAVYIPERHFYEFGSIFANSAVMAAYLIPQTQRIRFRTAGISLPLHHPAEVVEWWAMNDILSNGRIDLGFGTGWNKPDFIYSPENYEDRKQICWDRIPVVQKLWRGERHNDMAIGDKERRVFYPRWQNGIQCVHHALRYGPRSDGKKNLCLPKSP
jgi:natural product biosynthesis luciferase-like monooxygenase protein